MITRKNDWPIRLSNYLEKVKDKKFKWGTHDCVMHSVNAVRAITGTDLATGYRKLYRTEEKAREIVKHLFGDNTDNMFIECLGSYSYKVKKARRGDIARITFGDQKAYGIVDDTGRFVAMVSPKDGLVRLPLKKAELYWRVG